MNDVESMLSEFSQLQRQLQVVVMQKQQLFVAKEELKNANAELDQAKGKVFKMTGGLMIEVDVSKAKSSLSESGETIETRLVMLQKQEDSLKAKLSEIRKKIEGSPGAQGTSDYA